MTSLAGVGDPTSVSLPAPPGLPGLHGVELGLHLSLPRHHRQPRRAAAPGPRPGGAGRRGQPAGGGGQDQDVALRLLQSW